MNEFFILLNKVEARVVDQNVNGELSGIFAKYLFS